MIKHDKPQIYPSDSYSSSSTPTPLSKSLTQSLSSSEDSQDERQHETTTLRRSTRKRGIIDRWDYTVRYVYH